MQVWPRYEKAKALMQPVDARTAKIVVGKLLVAWVAFGVVEVVKNPADPASAPATITKAQAQKIWDVYAPVVKIEWCNNSGCQLMTDPDRWNRTLYDTKVSMLIELGKSAQALYGSPFLTLANKYTGAGLGSYYASSGSVSVH